MIGDLSRSPEETAWAYSAYGSVFGFSGIVGPLLSGLLYDPARLYPQLFNKTGYFGDRPYALPCFFCAFLTLLFLYTSIVFLKEKPGDYVKKKRDNYLYSETAVELDDLESPPTSPGAGESTPSKTRFHPLEPPQSLISKHYLAPIFLYCVIAYVSMVYMTAIPIYLSASQLNFGLSLSSQSTSMATMIISLTKFPLQVYGFQKFLKYFKSLQQCYKFGMLLLIPVHVLLPFLSLLSNWELFYLEWLFLSTSMILIGFAEVLAFLSVIMMITESATMDSQADMLGLVHGLASTCSASVRALSPPMAGFLWEMGNSPLVFGFNGVLILIFGIYGCTRLYPNR